MAIMAFFFCNQSWLGVEDQVEQTILLELGRAETGGEAVLDAAAAAAEEQQTLERLAVLAAEAAMVLFSFGRGKQMWTQYPCY